MADYYLDAFADIPSPGNLQPCYNCGRKFNVDTLERHENICQKLKTRKPFDSSKQRLGGVVPPEIQKTIKTSDPSPVKSKKNNWKQKHEDFINTIRSARGVTAAIKKGEPLPPPPPSTINPDYVQCPHCSRRFNEHAAERHMQFCKEQKARIGKSPSSAAKSRVAARTQYRPPPPSKKNSTATTAPIQTTKPKQTSTKPNLATTEYKPNKYEKQSQQLKNQGVKPQSANSNTMLNKQTGKLRDGASSAGVTKTNGYKGHYSNRYKPKDTYMEVLDNEDDKDIPLNLTREVKHGRRASKPRNGSLEDLPDEVEKMTLFEKTQHTKRNIAIRDPSPTLFDDFHHNTSTKKTTTKNKKPPFPSKAQVHSRPHEIGHRTETDGSKRLSKFCYECGTKYPVDHAKFCCECGTKRPFMNT